MIINAINKFCAKHGPLTYTFIGVVIIIPFVFLYGDFGGALQGGSSRNPVMGKLYDRNFTRKEFLQHLQSIRISYYLEYQRYLPANNDQVLKALSQEILNRIRALHKAKKLGLDKVTSQEIQEKILNYKVFLENDEFDRSKFNKFRDEFLKLEKVSAQAFDQIVKENIIVERLEKQITESIISPDIEARASYVENFTKCNAQVSTFYSYKYMTEVEVNEEEVEEYFNKNLETTYRVPEQKQIQAVVFDANTYLESSEIAEEKLKEYYETNKQKNYAKKQIHLKHILVKTDPDDSEEVKLEKKAKLRDVVKNIKDQGSFDDLAEAHSEDDVTAEDGGDLGFMDLQFIRNQYGPNFEEKVTNLKLEDVSHVIESSVGFHIVQKIGERDIVPFSEVKDQINTVLKRQRDEKEAKKYYDTNKEEEYSNEEVHARHILLKFEPADTEEVKKEKREKLETILKEAREKKNFYELAKLHSEDPSNANKGGDLGYFTRGKMVKPFEDAAFTMKKGEISEIIETQFGYHIIEKIDERKVQPFSDVKEDIIRVQQQEKKDKAKAIAVEKATRFAIGVHSALENVPKDQKAKAFVDFCRQVDKDKEAVIPFESGFFTAEDYAIPKIPGATTKLIKEAVTLNLDNPLSEVIESGDFYYVCCWQASKDSYLPEFKEKDSKKDTLVLSKQAKKAERDLKNEKAIVKAKEECRKAYEEIHAKLESKIPFEEAKGEVAFSPTGEFSLSQGPRVANKELIQNEAKKTAPNTLVPPKDIANGAILIFIENHILPTDEEYDNIKSYWIPQFQYQQQQAALQNYYKELEKESNTQISEEWQFLFETLPEDGADTDSVDAT